MPPLKDLPTLEQIVNRSRTDVKAQIPESDPYNQSGTINAELVAVGGRHREVYDQLQVISDETFIATASEETLLIRGAEFGLSLNPATQASGVAIFTGTPGTIVPQATEIGTSDGTTYKTTVSGTISNKNLTLDTITRIDTQVTVTVNGGHDLGSGMSITISGAVETEYNGTYTIIVISATQFTYTIVGAPTTPATGTFNAAYASANINVISDGLGEIQNQVGGTQLTLSSVTAGIDQSVKTTFAGIDGGTDQETIEEFRARVLFRKRNPATPFNVANITIQAQKVSGVTRVFVYEAQDLPQSETPTSLVSVGGFVTITFPSDHGILSGQKVTISGANETDFNGTFRGVKVSDTEFGYFSSGATGTATGTITVTFGVVELGQCLIYFVRDNDASIIPSSQEVADVKDSILVIKPANTSDDDVFVRAPSEISQDFGFTALSPDTVGIRSSIEANLEALFFDNGLGKSVTETQYNTAIQNSFDPETNKQVESFTIDVSGDIVADYNQIITLGTISYS